MNAYTSGTRRRAAIDAALKGAPTATGSQMQVIAELNRVDYGDNPILDLLRDEYPSEPNAYTTTEWLFQLARHWALWQSPKIGTFPLDYRDPSGPVSRELSEEGGDDAVYWAIEDVLIELADTNERNPDHTYRADAQDIIVHATRVLTKLDAALIAAGRGIA